MKKPDQVSNALLRRGFLLEYMTLFWNIVGIVILALAAWAARSVALVGFGLDSLIEICASIVVVWELSGTGEDRQRRALRLIGAAFAGLAVYLTVQSTIVLAIRFHPHHSPAGIVWTAITALVMFALAAGKARTGKALNNPVLQTEGRVRTHRRATINRRTRRSSPQRPTRMVVGRPHCRLRPRLLRRPRGLGHLHTPLTMRDRPRLQATPLYSSDRRPVRYGSTFAVRGLWVSPLRALRGSHRATASSGLTSDP